MKKTSTGRRAPPDSASQSSPLEKVGWIRKFCGKGIFREIWKNRFLILRGEQLLISQKEVRDLSRADEVLDLSDYDRCEEIRKNKSRSKKNHSKFRLQRYSSPGNTVPNLLFLAVSPEEKESWINVLNTAISRAKNRILDEVTVEESQLCHLTRDRVKIPHNRRLPTRGHLLAVASTSSSDGMLTLDLVQENPAPSQGLDRADGFHEEADKPVFCGSPDSPSSKTDSLLSAQIAVSSGKSPSLPEEKIGSTHNPDPGKRLSEVEKNCSASTDQIQTPSQTRTATTKGGATPPPRAKEPVGRLQELIEQKLDRTGHLLTEVRQDGGRGGGAGQESAEELRAEAQRLLQEAAAAWSQAREVLEEIKELRSLYQQLDPPPPQTRPHSAKLTSNRMSLM
ncbi:pleckstrin homology domain-containing family O member 1b [Oryzias melastigma]|nr:pleckstrin homology domain-containing family O member 1b [Oryzias melastigma]